MTLGYTKNPTGSEVATTESKGGIKYELVLEKPSCDAPAKIILSPTRQISAEEIAMKLKAAEERRLSIEAQKMNQIKNERIEEIKEKRENLHSKFRETVRESLEKRMEISKENRENILRSIESKAREHVEAVEAKRKQSMESGLNREKIFEQITRKLENAAESRDAQLQALKDRLKEREKKIRGLKEQMESQSTTTTECLKTQLDTKLNKATEKRDALLLEIQEKQKDHERHVEEVRQNRGVTNGSGDKQV